MITHEILTSDLKESNKKRDIKCCAIVITLPVRYFDRRFKKRADEPVLSIAERAALAYVERILLFHHHSPHCCGGGYLTLLAFLVRHHA